MLPFAANEQVLYSAAPEAHAELSARNGGAIKAASAPTLARLGPRLQKKDGEKL